LDGRGSSSRAKKAAAERRISLARRSSRFSPLEGLEPLALLGCQPRTGAGVDLGLAQPGAQRFGADAQLAGDPGHGAVAFTLLGDRLGHHADGALPHLGRVAALERTGTLVVWHDSIILQGMESPSN